MIENLKISIQSIWGHKMRSLLTMLGVIIGIAAIIAIFSMIEGNTAALKKQLAGGSTNTMAIMYGKRDTLEGPKPKKLTGTAAKALAEEPTYTPEITSQQLQDIRQLPGVKNAALMYEYSLNVFRQDKKEKTSVKATTPEYFDMLTYTLLEGRLLTQSDLKTGSQSIIIDLTLAKRLFGADSPIGKNLELKGTPFKIIGVVEETKTAEDEQYRFNNGPQAFIAGPQWYLLADSFKAEPQVLIQGDTTDSLASGALLTSEYLTDLLAPSNHIFGMSDFSDFEREMVEMNRSKFYLLGGIAGISLLVGGIGVMNIMLVSVTERTREIGVKMALGARKKIILSQFLIEAVVLTLTGGLLGIGFGLIGATILTKSLDYPLIVSLPVMVGSLLFSLLIGVIFGLMPAIKASRLSPIEALRYE